MPDEHNTIPKKNRFGFYEIRMESIGGLGANVAGKILVEAGILGQDLNGSSFSSYGSEKKGSPIKSFVRFCDDGHPVRVNSPVEEPHLLAVFHENLIKTENVVQGLVEEGVVIVNTRRDPLEMREALRLHSGTIGCIDALGIAIEEKTRLNTVMLGAIARASGFLDPEAIKEAMDNAFGKKYPQASASNRRGFDRGYNEVNLMTFEPDERFPRIPFKRYVPELGYKNAPIGGVVVNPGNMRQKDLSASRQGYIPLLDLSKCTNCGECDMTCPDYCFVWERGTTKAGKPAQFLKGINYQYCKGCLKCVEICKPKALTTVRETEVEVEAITLSPKKLEVT